MAEDLSWWAEVVFGGWRHRPGPRYQRLAAALLDAVDRRVLREGTRVPAERILAASVGVSRGTVVASFEQLVAAGVLRRRQGSGTYVVGRPSWAARPGGSGVAALLLQRMVGDRETIDLSVSSPGDSATCRPPTRAPRGPRWTAMASTRSGFRSSEPRSPATSASTSSFPPRPVSWSLPQVRRKHSACWSGP